MEKPLRTSQDYEKLANLLETDRCFKQSLSCKKNTNYEIFYELLGKATKVQKEFNLRRDDSLKEKHKESLELLDSLAIKDEMIKADFKSLENLRNFIDKNSNLVVYSCCVGIGAAAQMFFSQIIYEAINSNYNGFIFIDKSNNVAEKIGISKRQLSSYINAAQELGIIIPAKYFGLENEQGKRFIKKMFLLDVERLLDTLKYLQMNKIKFTKFYKEEIKKILEASPFKEDKNRLAEMIAKEEARKKNRNKLEALKEDNLSQAQRIKELEAEIERLKANVNKEAETKATQEEILAPEDMDDNDELFSHVFDDKCDDIIDTSKDNDKKEMKTNIEPPHID